MYGSNARQEEISRVLNKRLDTVLEILGVPVHSLHPKCKIPVKGVSGSLPVHKFWLKLTFLKTPSSICLSIIIHPKSTIELEVIRLVLEVAKKKRK